MNTTENIKGSVTINSTQKDLLKHIKTLSEQAIEALNKSDVARYDRLKANMAHLEREYDKLLLDIPCYILKNKTMPSGLLTEYLLINPQGVIKSRVTSTPEGLIEHLKNTYGDSHKWDTISPLEYHRLINTSKKGLLK